MPTDLQYFVSKWNASTLTERSAAQQHFRDLCEALGVSHPTQDADDVGASYTYEKRVAKAGSGDQGFADVWKRGWFAWEYKSKGGDLKKAYKQLNEYHESLENPPLLVVCDFVHFEVHTKFENAPPRVFAFTLDDLLVPSDTATCALPPLEVLRNLFGDYNKLRPEVVAIPVTRAAAEDFLRLAQRLELERALSPDPPTKEQIAHFLMRLVFCLFADSVSLLPDSTFRRLVTNHRHSPISFNRALPHLFQAMSEPDSFFGPANIPYFNGGLFRDNTTIPLDHADLGILKSAAHHDWSHVEPAIFGTLFERSLDSAKRSMIGAHYTSPEDILLLIEPVVVAPLLRRWEAVKQSVLDALAAEPPLNKDGKLHASLRTNRPALQLLQAWAAELTQVRILDPACGSGNFLYLALKRLLDLWHTARSFGLKHGLALALDPIPSPGQLYGIEIDFYAHEIASIVVWIGFLQWKHDHGYREQDSPLLKVLTNIQRDDAVLRFENGSAYEPIWPSADFIIGNPPFLGGKKLRRELNDHYVDALFGIYKGRVAAESDLVIYWFEKARGALATHDGLRVGLLSTQQIRKGFNQRVLKRVAEIGAFFWAVSSQRWFLTQKKTDRSGDTKHKVAQVRISMIAFDNGSESNRMLDGQHVSAINSDLSTGVDVTRARVLAENEHLCSQGPTRVGEFDLEETIALSMLRAPLNVNGRPNSDVVKRYVRTTDLTDRDRRAYIVDFGTEMSEREAAAFELPFEYIARTVQAYRVTALSGAGVDWWRHQRPRPELRKALKTIGRYILTPRTSKFRLFVWMQTEVVPDTRIYAMLRDDDYFFGALHSRAQEEWALANCAWHGVGNDPTYVKETCFDTFPFPWPPGTEPSEADSPIVRAIADAARNLVKLRDNWLNPPDTPADELKKRTLTNLYNARPTWLANAHRTLDEAVFAAYGWPANLTTQQVLANLLALNQERAAAQKPVPTLRKKVRAVIPPGPMESGT